MEFNKDILQYCVRGAERGDPNRYAFTALRVFIEGFKNIDRRSFDDPVSYYSLEKKAFSTGDLYLFVRHVEPGSLKVVSPEEYVSILIGQPFDLHWYENLEVGSTVRMGWADTDGFNSYNFGFTRQYVNDYINREVTIADIRDYCLTSKEAFWHNGDDRIYFVKEFDHWFPSAVFVPLLNTTPIKKLDLTSISIKGLEL